ncbi:MAG: type II toxin-antitoxin system VapC family toxin [Verrucomicrobiota bacterium]|nr:type II toxin-antitoxin system VapC family toxin [Verrucomicrobiota bacterium]
MKYLLDSNIWIYALANISKATCFLTKTIENENGAYSSITRIEVLGYNKIEKNEILKLRQMLDLLDELKMSDLLDELKMSDKIIKKTITLKQMVAIKTPDAIIAATALINNLVLVTRNTQDFTKIKNIKILNPFD